MVEVRDFPGLGGALQLLGGPLDLLRLGIGAVERNEPDVLLRRLERVVELALHVEELVVALLTRVVVAERTVELHAGVEERLVRLFELLLEVLRPLTAVDVVPHENDELVLESLADGGHLFREVVLRLRAGAEVSEDGKLQRAIAVRHRRRGGGP